MNTWLPNNDKVYLPPTPAARILNTEDYVTRTSLYYHANSDRLLTIGHPYFELVDAVSKKLKVPKVSGNQYRVFRIQLPDPNRFALTDKGIFDPEKERLVWGCRGLEVSRGLPLGVGLSGHPYFNRKADNENPDPIVGPEAVDTRQNMAFDVKQSQVIMVGCVPQMGEHWQAALPCADPHVQPPPLPGECPPLELVSTIIEDGDMADLGFGAMDFKNLQHTKADAPLDLVDTISKYPDYIKMNQDIFGDMLFFYARREQCFTRHFMSRTGRSTELPSVNTHYIPNQQKQAPPTSIYYGTPSGSLVSSDAQLFNRPYWLQRAQGHNNGIAWQNQLFVTILDNTRGTNMTVSVSTQNALVVDHYDDNDYAQYLRHAEEFELSFVFQLCKVQLTTEALAHIHTMNPKILEDWHIGLRPPPSASVEDQYRYIQSLATRCPPKEVPAENDDPYKTKKFWVVDLSTRFSTELDQFPLGRRFLFQSGAISRKRPRPGTSTSTPKKAVKRKRKT
uniref:Major capsid protein L1 n=1 Tax=Florida manatee papillomavirus TaxID=255363 RepID=Q52P64_9PAPI|nr:L1 capsid protein [Florida manatee papillomavirus]AAZ20323.1 L1 capsid protein [Florida manatee papillomavirus]